MTVQKKFITITFAGAFALLFLALAYIASTLVTQLPVTGAARPQTEGTLVSEAEFAGAFTQLFASEAAKNNSTVVRVTVPGVLDYQVVQSGNSVPSGYAVGQYGYAARKNNIGLLAHNYAAGGSFYALSSGMEVIVTYSNGQTATYVINNVMRYQATDPTNYGKPFIDSRGKEISAKQVFNQAYRRNGLTFQTCLWGEGSATWGLLFVQAVPKK
jgi:hypothetical protein